MILTVTKTQKFEAIKWDGNADTANKFIGENYGVDWKHVAANDNSIMIPVANAKIHLMVGSYLVKEGGTFKHYTESQFNSMFRAAN